MLQCAVTGSTGELRAHLSHPVAQRDRPGRIACARKRSRCLVRRPRDVDAALGHHPHGFGVQRLRVAAGAARGDDVVAACVEQRLGDLRAGAVPGAEEQHAWLAAVRGAPDATRRRAGARARGAARRRPRRAARRTASGRAGSSCRARRPSCGADVRGPRSRSAPRWYETRLGALPSELGQLADPAVAPAEVGQQLPALGSATSWRNSSGVGVGGHRRRRYDHVRTRYIKQLDASRGTRRRTRSGAGGLSRARPA